MNAQTTNLQAVNDADGYRALLAQLASKAPGEYVTDECIDRENVLVDGRTEASADFWQAMAQAAAAAAQMRLQDLGVSA